jgi:hypothetical protein
MDLTPEQREQVATIATAINRAIRKSMHDLTGETHDAPIHTHVIGLGIVWAVRELNEMNATEALPHVFTRFVAENLAGCRLNDVFGKPGN